jgi:hypothetical protein
MKLASRLRDLFAFRLRLWRELRDERHVTCRILASLDMSSDDTSLSFASAILTLLTFEPCCLRANVSSSRFD